jgi:hypothetical protein
MLKLKKKYIIFSKKNDFLAKNIVKKPKIMIKYMKKLNFTIGLYCKNI